MTVYSRLGFTKPSNGTVPFVLFESSTAPHSSRDLYASGLIRRSCMSLRVPLHTSAAPSVSSSMGLGRVCNRVTTFTRQATPGDGADVPAVDCPPSSLLGLARVPERVTIFTRRATLGDGVHVSAVDVPPSS